jgi:transposase
MPLLAAQPVTVLPEQREELEQLVRTRSTPQQLAIPAVHGVMRWRACDLIMRLYEEFGLSVSDDTVYRALKDLGFLACEREADGL